MHVDVKKLIITLKILKSENLHNSKHIHVHIMAIRYTCLHRLAILIVIKLGKTLDYCLHVCKHDKFVHPNFVLFLAYLLIWGTDSTGVEGIRFVRYNF